MSKKIESGMVTISIRLDKNVKKRTRVPFLGTRHNHDVAINIFLRRCLIENTLPFEVGLYRPNARTAETIEELESMKRGYVPEQATPSEKVFKKK